MSNKILVTKSSMPELEEYVEEIKDLWDSHWLTNMGVKHKELQKKLEEYLDIEHVALYTNGHLALENAISALNLPKGSYYDAIYICINNTCNCTKWFNSNIL